MVLMSLDDDNFARNPEPAKIDGTVVERQGGCCLTVKSHREACAALTLGGG
jgi:hypothetical protein